MKNQSILKSDSRWYALDLFRGITIAAMIIVNNPGDFKNEYYQLGHASWHGITLADFVFPFFLFIVGVSIVISLSNQLNKGIPRKQIYRKIVKRTFIIFLLGLTVSLLVYPASGGFRIAGVLQRIALVYLFCSFFFLNLSVRFQVLLGGLILLGYWLLLAFFPVPDVGHASIEPINNLVSWFDREFLPGMLYDGEHDPEGILSTIPSIVSGLIGVLIGSVSLDTSKKTTLIKRIWPIGLSMLSIGVFWHFLFPLNKNLWTSSFVLVTGGAAIFALVITTWITDVKNIRYGTKPFIVFGTNAIASYMLSFVFLYLVFPPLFGAGNSIHYLVNSLLFETGLPSKLCSLIWAILYTGLCFVPVFYMYKKKVFLKV